MIAQMPESFSQKYGIKAGLNFSNMLDKNNDETFSDDYQTLLGFHFGPTAEFKIDKTYTFETGLLLSSKGFKAEMEELYEGGLMEVSAKISLLYLDIPLNFKAGYDLGGAKIHGLFGPYLGIGLTGKAKYKVSYQGETVNEDIDIEWGSDPDEAYFRRFDFGFNIGAGVEFNAFQIGLNYSVGIANISPYSEGGYKNKNRVFNISLGYRFAKNKTTTNAKPAKI